MLNISIAEECADALNKRYVRDFNVDCVTGRIADALEKLSDTVHWNVIGLKVMAGKREIEDSLRDMNRADIVGFSLDNALLQGNRVIATGVIDLKNGSSMHFCDVYVFENYSGHAKISGITTYGIPVQKPEPAPAKASARA